VRDRDGAVAVHDAARRLDVGALEVDRHGRILPDGCELDAGVTFVAACGAWATSRACA
jgi:hypothetical protein